MATDGESDTARPIVIESPTLEDAAEMHRLAQASGVLDVNSRYDYLLCCSLFRQTCRVARKGDEVVGFVTAMRKPEADPVLFVWQVAVDSTVRGQGLGPQMLTDLINAECADGGRFVEATVSPDNTASYRMFEKAARESSAVISRKEGFPAALFEPESHEPEDLVLIGPIYPAGDAGG